MGDTSKRQQSEMLESVVGNDSRSIPHLYANSALNNVSTTEITTTWTFDGRPLAAIIMPLSLAKSYARLLQALIANYEGVAGFEVPLLEDLVVRNEALKQERTP